MITLCKYTSRFAKILEGCSDQRYKKYFKKMKDPHALNMSRSGAQVARLIGQV